MSGARCHPIVSCFIKVQIALNFLVLAYSGCLHQEAIKRVTVVVRVFFTEHVVMELQAECVCCCC